MTRPLLAPPLVLVALDEFGRRVAGRVAALAARPTAADPIVKVAEVGNLADVCEATLREREQERRVQVLIPIAAAGAAKVDEVLGAVAALETRIAGIRPNASVVLRLEEGFASEVGDLVAGWTSSPTPVAAVYLVSARTEYNLALDQESVQAEAATIAYLHATTTLSENVEPSETCWAVGASAVALLREDLVERLGAARVSDVLDQALLAPGRDPYEARGKALPITLDLHDDTLERELLRTPVGSRLDELKVERLRYRRVPVVHWPDRLASYFDFLRVSRLVELLDQVQTAGAKAASRLRGQLSGLLDQVLLEAPEIQSAERFLTAGRMGLKQVGHEAERMRDETDASVPDLALLKQRLVAAIRGLPYWPAVLARWTLIGFLLWQGLLGMEHVLRARGVVSGLLAPPAWIVATLAWGIAAVGAGGKLGLAWRRVLRARTAFTRGIEDYLRAKLLVAIREQVTSAIGDLLVTIGEDGATTGELAAVRRYRAICIEARTSVDDRVEAPVAADLSATTLTTSVQELVGLQRAVDELGASLAVSGTITNEGRELAAAFTEWRTLDAPAMVERSVSWARGKYESVRRLRLSDVLDRLDARDDADAFVEPRCSLPVVEGTGGVAEGEVRFCYADHAVREETSAAQTQFGFDETYLVALTLARVKFPVTQVGGR